MTKVCNDCGSPISRGAKGILCRKCWGGQFSRIKGWGIYKPPNTNRDAKVESPADLRRSKVVGDARAKMAESLKGRTNPENARPNALKTLDT